LQKIWNLLLQQIALDLLTAPCCCPTNWAPKWSALVFYSWLTFSRNSYCLSTS